MAAPPEKVQQLAEELKKISYSLASEQTAELTPSYARRVRKTISEAYENLSKVMADLDPVKHPGVVFDPSNPNVVGRLVGITMVAQDRKPLAAVERFYGSGVYAIYYNGDFRSYKALSKKEHPIYVGKADPADPASKTAMDQGDRLSRRLGDHCRNITKAESTLRLDDFEYRALVVQTGWQDAAENYLIHLFKPIWNNEIGICYGFGKHGDDPATRANLRSPWDTLHPGRDWAHRDRSMKDARPVEQINADIAAHLAAHTPFTSIERILRTFLDEIRAVS
jgi:hypothetical protein